MTTELPPYVILGCGYVGTRLAQSLLALGARIARKRPEFAEDLRAAQRVLLLLHFS